MRAGHRCATSAKGSQGAAQVGEASQMMEQEWRGPLGVDEVGRRVPGALAEVMRAGRDLRSLGNLIEVA